jgi:hypothetical protein
VLDRGNARIQRTLSGKEKYNKHGETTPLWIEGLVIAI